MAASSTLKLDSFTNKGVKRVCCIGAGYVGGPTMAVLAEHCSDVIFTVVDIDEARVAAWNSSSLPIFEPGLSEAIERVRGKNLFFSTSVKEEVSRSQIVFIAVNTGTKEYGLHRGEAYDLSAVEAVTRTIASAAKGNTIVVEKSTVPVFTADRVQWLLESNKTDGAEFEVLSNPEFLAEGMAMHNLEQPDRVLVGGAETARGRAAAEQLCDLYRRFVPTERVLVANVYSSELSKLAANAFLAQRVSSINAFSAICEETGANVAEVAAVLGSDERIGPKFLKASVGFGGSCFRKDLLGLIYLCDSLRLEPVANYWRQVLAMNEYQKERFTKTIMDAMFGTLRRKKIAVLGFAFKKDTGDHRDSAAIAIVRHLVEELACVQIYDPKVPHDTIKQMFPTAECHTSAYDACDGAAALVLLTEWDEFVSLDYQRIYDSMLRPTFAFDGRNVLDHQALIDIGFTVRCIGKRYH
jgi:UDPglucose 6-dehydrogenase